MQVEPVNPFTQTQRQELETRTLIPSLEHGFELLHKERLAFALPFFFGSTISVTGITTAAAIRRIRMIVSSAKAQMGMPQHFRERCFSSYEVGELGAAVWVRDSPDFCIGEGQREPGWSPVGVLREGEGKAARMSDIEPGLDPRVDWNRALSLSSSIFKKPNRLAVRPRSRFAASLVARRINSGRLLVLPRVPSFSFTASRLSLAGRFPPFSLIVEVVGLNGDVLPLDASAPPFSRPPRTCFTLGSKGVVGVLDPEVG